MTGIITKATLGVALAASTLVAVAPAEAQYYRGRHRDRGGDVATGALVGGIVGLGLGAAIASSNRNRYYDRGYYDRGYYRDRGYYYGPGPRGYYRQRYRAPRAYYRDHYYAPRAYYGRPYRGYYGY